jgi:hypothetical protein
MGKFPTAHLSYVDTNTRQNHEGFFYLATKKPLLIAGVRAG